MAEVGRIRVLALAVLTALGCALAFNAGVAGALPKAPSFTIGSEGGQLSQARGIAVNESGEGGVDPATIYVADFGSDRISSFDADGNFIRAWGWGVDTGAEEFELCTDAKSCKAGISGGGAGQFNAIAGGIAVQEDSGNVLVLDRGNHRIQQFSATGAFIRTWGKNVDSTGGDGFEICEDAEDCQSGEAGTGAGEFTFGTLTIASVGTDSSGNVYVPDANNARVQKFGPTGAFERMAGWDVVDGVNHPGAPGDDTVAPINQYEVCTDPATCKAGVGGEAATQFARTAAANSTTPGFLATSPDGDVYVVARKNGTIYRLTSALAFGEEYAATVAGTANPNRNAIAVNPDDGHVFFGVKDPIAAGPNTNIYELDPVSGTITDTHPAGNDEWVGLAVNGATGSMYGTRTTSATFVQVFEEGLPSLTIQPPDPSTGTKATMKGTVNPNGVEVVECFFEWGPTTSYGNTAPCDPDAATIGDGTDPEPVEADLTGLVPNGATYHYRLVAVGDKESRSANQSFTTPVTVVTAAATLVTTTTATLHGSVNPDGAAITECLFEYGTTTAFGETAPCDPAAGSLTGTDPVSVEADLTDLNPGAAYYFRLKSTYGGGTGPVNGKRLSFLTLGPVPGIPSATTSIDPDTGEGRAAVYGKVNPNGKATTYRFEYMSEADFAANGGSFTGPNQPTAVPEPDADIGGGVADIPISQPIAGLEPGTAYRLRVLAENLDSPTESPHRAFTTPPVGAPGNCDNEAIREQQGIAATVPDCRAYEIVSPADKGSSGMVADLLFVQQHWNQASPDGDSMLYPIQNGIEESTAGGWTRWRAGRTDDGWLSAQVSAPSLKPKDANSLIVMPSFVVYTSPDLSCAILYTSNPLTADTPQASVNAGMENLYRWNAADGSYDLITNVVPSNPGQSSGGGHYNQVETSDDCSRVWFRTVYQLIPGVNDVGVSVDGEFGIYEWDQGDLRYAGALPDGSIGAKLQGTVIGRAVLGAEASTIGTARWNAASPDGSRFFFSAISKETGEAGRPAVFMREDGGANVVNISRSQTAVPTNGARFEAASPDGSRAFFRANYGIAATSSPGPTNEQCGPIPGSSAGSETRNDATPPLEPKPCDLYAYEVETGELTNLSADTNPADPAGAQIQGTIAVSEDGSHVYFAALGQLIPGKGRTYAQNVAGQGSANVYLHRDDELAYVTTLSRVDLLGGGPGDASPYSSLMRAPTKWMAEASADGNRLVFESRENLTGQDPAPVKAVYLYSADTGEISCISCRLDGEASLVQTITPMLGRNRLIPTTYRPRRMSEDGSRIFFSSPDVLAPGAVPGGGAGFAQRNVYQWQDGQVRFLAVAKPSGGNGLGVYMDASADGDTVFLATMEQLVPEDKDFVSDVYAVRAGGGFLFTEPPPGCQVDEAVPLVPNQIYCQGAAAAQPGPLGPASANFLGAGNPLEPKGKAGPRCNRKQVRRGKRCVAKRALARRACAKRRGKAKQRCIANQVRRLNRANANRGGNK